MTWASLPTSPLTPTSLRCVVRYASSIRSATVQPASCPPQHCCLQPRMVTILNGSTSSRCNTVTVSRQWVMKPKASVPAWNVLWSLVWVLSLLRLLRKTARSLSSAIPTSLSSTRIAWYGTQSVWFTPRLKVPTTRTNSCLSSRKVIRSRSLT
ncbi:hypothetical protein D3C84_828700 [compost metagenome]